MKLESIAECSPWSILQYFWPALSENWSWKTVFGLFESGCFRQALLYSSQIFQQDCLYSVPSIQAFLSSNFKTECWSHIYEILYHNCGLIRYGQKSTCICCIVWWTTNQNKEKMRFTFHLSELFVKSCNFSMQCIKKNVISYPSNITQYFFYLAFNTL